MSLNSSKEIPFVSGIIKCTKSNCKTIKNAKIEKTTPAPIELNKSGTSEGMIAAKTQWTLVPKDWPAFLK